MSPRLPSAPSPASTRTASTSRFSSVVYQRLLFDYLAENRWTMAAFAVVMLLTLPVESVVLPRYYGQMFEVLRGPATGRGAVTQSEHVSNWRTSLMSMWHQRKTAWGAKGVFRLFWTIVMIWGGVLVAYAAKHTLEAHVIPSYTSFVRRKLFTGMVEKHSVNYRDIRVGEEVTRIMDVSRNMKNLLCWVLSDLVPVYLATLVLVGYLFWTSPLIGGVACVGVLLHTAVFVGLAGKSVDLSASREHYYLQMSEKLHDSFGNLMNVYLNNMKSSEIEANARTEEVHSELLNIQLMQTRNLTTTLKVLSVITFLVTIGVTCHEVRRGAVSSTTFVTVWIIVLLYLTSMLNLSSETPMYITQLGILQCSNGFLENILQATESTVSEHEITEGHVAFRDVSFAYPGSDRPTLHDFTFEVAAKEKVGILGTSGSGKTTAMKLLSGMYQAQGGAVQIDGVDLQKYDTQHLRQHVNYINQRTQLFNTSVIENMQYGNHASAKQIRELLETYELDTVYSKLREGIDTRAGVGGGTLSIGMQKVTMLMRGLLRDGKVVVLDEPLAGLDAASREKVLKLIRDRCENRTLIVITHDKEIIPMMDRMVNLGELNHPERHMPPSHHTAETATTGTVLEDSLRTRAADAVDPGSLASFIPRDMTDTVPFPGWSGASWERHSGKMI